MSKRKHHKPLHPPHALSKKTPTVTPTTTKPLSKKQTTSPRQSNDSSLTNNIPNPHHPKSNIPFSFTNDSILLIGEGDFSFSHSLIHHHVALDVTSTSYDSQEEVYSKYPQSLDLIRSIQDEEPSTRILHCVDGTNISKTLLKALKTQPVDGDKRREETDIDARRKNNRSDDGTPTFDRVVFNFPHVGGKSTDVNRQVRANQQLLVGFFHSVKNVLKRNEDYDKLYQDGDARDGDGDEGGEANGPATVIVTLFEGEPYTLWNIRDLARHSGFQVQRSFKFDAKLWPGYKHARTLGNVDGGGGWKGEEREARTYVFTCKTNDIQKNPTRKRKRGNDDDDDNDEDGDD